MTVSIVRSDQTWITRWLYEQSNLELKRHEQEIFNRCFLTSTELWVGFNNDQLVCIWGLVPPTLLADYAYLWLYTTPMLEGNEFFFVRHSQRVMEDMLTRYPIIVGHTKGDVPGQLRWLSWLGARFGERDESNGLIPFQIRKRKRG